ncbi:MAG: septal ring lytic transglycosylase RlpA family protein [Beijerinckiaceae bacterium]|nr:septal ring lytic transglycosylase RlpA family protein [Beijerinckiaceae bacterium]
MPFPAHATRLSQSLFLLLAAGAAASLGGCAQSGPQRLAYANSKEYFPSSIYGPASPRVVADGEPVPRGGGMYMVGKPYTIAGHTYYPSERRYAATGLASWYGDAFHGRRTANGEVYDKDAVSAAHPTMPLPSYARVTNLRNRHSMIVRVNDRGPFASRRILDVSRKVAHTLDFHHSGTTPVRVEYLAAASLAGSDDQKLLATLRTDGPALLEQTAGREQGEFGAGSPAAIARAEVPSSVDPEGTVSVRSASVLAAYFKGNPVPLPPARPMFLKTHAGNGASAALRRASLN